MPRVPGSFSFPHSGCWVLQETANFQVISSVVLNGIYFEKCGKQSSDIHIYKNRNIHVHVFLSF